MDSEAADCVTVLETLATILRQHLEREKPIRDVCPATRFAIQSNSGSKGSISIIVVCESAIWERRMKSRSKLPDFVKGNFACSGRLRASPEKRRKGSAGPTNQGGDGNLPRTGLIGQL